MKKLALIIDAQNGFMEGGGLPVNGATKSMNELADYLAKTINNYDAVVATVDWHPYTHCSFKHMGGEWPIHCLQFSNDAALYQPLLDVINTSGIPFSVYTKGTNEDREEYSIFRNIESSKKLKELILKNNFGEIDVFGIAFDYCVKETVLDGLRELPNVVFNIYEKYTPKIGDGKEFIEIIENTERLNLIN